MITMPYIIHVRLCRLVRFYLDKFAYLPSIDINFNFNTAISIRLYIPVL